MQFPAFRRDIALTSVQSTVAPVCSFEQFVEFFVDQGARPGRLVIREDLPHIAVMRAGIRIGLTFTFEILDEGPRMIAARTAAA